MKQVDQPESSLMQLWLASAHATAAIIASSIAVTHWLAVLHHLNRVNLSTERRNVEPSGDSGELDLTYAEALRRKDAR